MKIFPVLLLLVVGCTHPIFDEKYIEVNDFGVNRVEILYQEGENALPVRLKIAGTGTVEVETGTSPMEGNHFSIDYTDGRWNDTRKYRQSIAPEDARMIFQTLVNLGLCLDPSDPPDDWPKDKKPEKQAFVWANLNGRMIKREILWDKELLSETESLVKMFYRKGMQK